MTNILELLQKIATVLERLDSLRADFGDFRKEAGSALKSMQSEVVDLRERVARLETTNRAERDTIDARISRLHAEVDRALVRIAHQANQLLDSPE